MNLLERHRSAVYAAAVALPVLVCLLIVPWRDAVASPNAALLLVLVVVAAASTGLRAAGVLAALSGALAFDFFLTAPYLRLSIADRADVETAVLLVLVGVAVTEVALWGRRQQAQASRQSGYLAGVLGAVSSVAAGDTDAKQLTDQVADQLGELLGVDAVRFAPRLTPPVSARLERDGSVTQRDHTVDVQRSGLPTDTEIELLVQSGGTVSGRYLLTASTRIYRPTLEQRRVAVAVADQVGAALLPRGHAEPRTSS